MSKKRNSVFSGVVPVLGTSQTTAPISLGAAAISRHGQNLSYSFVNADAVESDPTVRYSTGSTLLDSFVQTAEYDAFRLQSELTTLSLELKRIANPASSRRRSRAPQNGSQSGSQSATQGTSQSATAPAPSEAVQAKQKAIAQARQQAQQQAQKALQQAQRLTQGQSQPPTQAQNLQRQNLQNQNLRRQDAAEAKRPPEAHSSQSPDSIKARLAQIARSQAASQQQRRAQVGPAARPETPLSRPQSAPIQSPAVKVYGGADYKAMQARAQAGGLVNLEDSLLFGGTEASAKKTQKADAISPEQTFLVWLSEPLEDFTASPVPGGWHPTAHLDASNLVMDAEHQTVLDIHSFKLDELATELPEDSAEHMAAEAQSAAHVEQSHSQQTHSEHAHVEQANVVPADIELADAREGDADAMPMGSDDEMAALNALGKQVTYLNQRIEFLSKKLAEITADESSAAHSADKKEAAGFWQRRSSVVLALDAFDPSEERVAERRLATLEPLLKAM